MLLLEPTSDHQPASPVVSETAAQQYNLRLAAHAHRQILVTEPALLEAIRNELPAYLSCFSYRPGSAGTPIVCRI
jgi:hypothetical protein